MGRNYYASYEHLEGELWCENCHLPMEKGEVVLSYLENTFPVELPVCKKCGQVFIPESLVVNEMLRVEKSLEDK